MRTMAAHANEAVLCAEGDVQAALVGTFPEGGSG